MKRSFVIVILFSILMLTACDVRSTVVAPSPIPGNVYTQVYLSLDATTATKLNEIHVLTAKGHNGHVAKVKYVTSSNKILGVYSDGGYVIGWNIGTVDPVIKYALGIVSSKALEFNKSGNLLMGATRHVFKPTTWKPNMSNQQETEYIDAISLWNMETGSLIRCYGSACDAAQSDTTVGRIGAVMDSTGRRTLYYTEGSISVSDGGIIFLNSPDSDIGGA